MHGAALLLVIAAGADEPSRLFQCGSDGPAMQASLPVPGASSPGKVDCRPTMRLRPTILSGAAPRMLRCCSAACSCGVAGVLALPLVLIAGRRTAILLTCVHARTLPRQLV